MSRLRSPISDGGILATTEIRSPVSIHSGFTRHTMAHLTANIRSEGKGED